MAITVKQFTSAVLAEYGTFSAWITALGLGNNSIEIGTDTEIVGTVVVPANIDIKGFLCGAKFTGTGSLTINKMSADPQHQIFDNSLIVMLKSGLSRPEWFGAVQSFTYVLSEATDCTQYVVKALKAVRQSVPSVAGYGTVVIKPGTLWFYEDICGITEGAEYVGAHTGSNNSLTLVDSTRSWEVDELKYTLAWNTTKGTVHQVESNTSNTITFLQTDSGFGTDWDTGDEYRLSRHYCGVTIIDNSGLNTIQSPGGRSILDWAGHTNVIVNKYRPWSGDANKQRIQGIYHPNIEVYNSGGPNTPNVCSYVWRSHSEDAPDVYGEKSFISKFSMTENQANDINHLLRLESIGVLTGGNLGYSPHLSIGLFESLYPKRYGYGADPVPEATYRYRTVDGHNRVIYDVTNNILSYPVAITEDAGTYTAGSISVIVNGQTVTQSYSSTKAATLAALAARVLSEAGSFVCLSTYNATTREILFYPQPGVVLAITIEYSGITGTMTAVVASRPLENETAICVNGAIRARTRYDQSGNKFTYNANGDLINYLPVTGNEVNKSASAQNNVYTRDTASVSTRHENFYKIAGSQVYREIIFDTGDKWTYDSGNNISEYRDNNGHVHGNLFANQTLVAGTNTLLRVDIQKYFNNTGLTASANPYLPDAIVGYKISFVVTAAYLINIRPKNGSSDIIRGPYTLASSNTVGSMLTLACHVVGTWEVENRTGTWAIS